MKEFKDTIERKIKLSVERDVDESNTKAYLIEPFLKLLGYDVSDIFTVQREFKITDYDKDDSVDYAIMIDGDSVIFIEAKRVGESVENTKHIKQLRRYFNSNPSIKYAILTNGRHYHLYTDTDNSNVMDSEPILKIDVLKNIEESKYITFPEILSNKNYFIQRKKEILINEIIGRDRSVILIKLKSSFENIINDYAYVSSNIQISDVEFTHLLESLLCVENVPVFNVIEGNNSLEQSKFTLSEDFDPTGHRLIEASVLGKSIKKLTFSEVLNEIIAQVPFENLEMLLNVNNHYKSKKYLAISNDVSRLNNVNQVRHVKREGYYIGANLSARDVLALCKIICVETGLNSSEIIFKLDKHVSL